MKKIVIRFLCFVIFGFLASGCGTIYKVVVDERNVQTQAKDEQITLDIRSRIIDDDQVKFMDVSTSVYEGDVYLVGEYTELVQKKRAIKIAKEVEGVKSVTDYFLKKKNEGDQCGSVDDLGLIARIKAKFIADTEIWSTNINVKTVQCNAVLLGIVGSKKEISLAVAHAREVEGVRRVKSYLKTGK